MMDDTPLSISLCVSLGLSASYRHGPFASKLKNLPMQVSSAAV